MKILITGASSGIGKEMAKILNKDGNELILVARDIEKLNKVKKELENDGGKIEIFNMDLSNEENCIELHKNVENVDILINNARVWGLWQFYENKLRQRIKYDKN